MANFTLKKSTDFQDTRNIVVNGVVVGTVERRMDFIKRSQSDRLRTKWAACNDVCFESEALAKVFNTTGQIIRQSATFSLNNWSLRDREVRIVIENQLARLESYLQHNIA